MYESSNAAAAVVDSSFFASGRAIKEAISSSRKYCTATYLPMASKPMNRHGYIADYTGIRVSRTGRRFRIEQAVVWNVSSESDQPCGQAAAFSLWTMLDS